jgi:hypothetical protein
MTAQNGGNATVAWGTDNSSAITNAIAACIDPSNLIPTSASGCTVYFPGPTLLTTGRYFLGEQVVITLNGKGNNAWNLTLLGGGSIGSNAGDIAAYPPAATSIGGLGATSEIVGSGRFPLMTFGAFSQANEATGLNISNLGFRDFSGNIPAATSAYTAGNTWGGIRIINVTHPYISGFNGQSFAMHADRLSGIVLRHYTVSLQIFGRIRVLQEIRHERKQDHIDSAGGACSYFADSKRLRIRYREARALF